MVEVTPRPQPAPKHGAILATVVVVAVVGFIALSHGLHVGSSYAGLLFFWYWGAIGEAKLARLPAMLVGALTGVAIAWLLQLATRSHDGAAIIGVLLLIVGAVFIQVMELVPIAVNASTMLFLTVAAAPLLQGSENFGVLIGSIILSALYFGAIVLLVSRRGTGGNSVADNAP